ncbi:regulatory iron-sulfur-containing complex subunit RicT [Candidatus Margulisiibacteriota bacterium]
MEQKLAIRLRNKEICPISTKSEDSIKIGAPVVVKTSRGEEFGEIVAFPNKYPSNTSKEIQLKKVLRYATEQDIRNNDLLQEKEESVLLTAAEKAGEFELPLKIISAEYLFDCKKLYLYYRVPKDKKVKDIRDFRRDLSSTFKTEITLRSITGRDEAKHIGGLGPCGRNLCCANWLNKPKHITVKMVKEQGFQISPTRTSGLCGRLMCCFNYELEKKAPRQARSNKNDR